MVRYNIFNALFVVLLKNCVQCYRAPCPCFWDSDGHYKRPQFPIPFPVPDSEMLQTKELVEAV